MWIPDCSSNVCRQHPLPCWPQYSLIDSRLKCSITLALQRAMALERWPFDSSICRTASHLSWFHAELVVKAWRQASWCITVMQSRLAYNNSQLPCLCEREQLCSIVAMFARRRHCHERTRRSARHLPVWARTATQIHQSRVVLPAKCRRPRRARRWARRRCARSSPTWCCPRRWTRRGALLAFLLTKCVLALGFGVTVGYFQPGAAQGDEQGARPCLPWLTDTLRACFGFWGHCRVFSAWCCPRRWTRRAALLALAN